MQSLLMLTVAVCMAITGSAGQDDSCAMYYRVGKCCPLSRIFPSPITTRARECKRINYTFKPPKTHSEIKAAFACSVECAFSKEGLLDATGKLDKVAVTNLFTPTEAALVPEITALIEQCLGSYEAEVDTSLECKSGAKEFTMCFKRQSFLNCPSSISTASSECDELKAKTINCPKALIAA